MEDKTWAFLLSARSANAHAIMYEFSHFTETFRMRQMVQHMITASLHSSIECAYGTSPLPKPFAIPPKRFVSVRKIFENLFKKSLT
jgi:hypothetical protein